MGFHAYMSFSGDLRSQLFPLKELIAMLTDELITMSDAQGDRLIWVARIE